MVVAAPVSKKAIRWTGLAYGSGINVTAACGKVILITEGRSQAILEVKVAVITRGAAGIGKTTAILFSQQGCKVVIADIQDDLGHSVWNEIGPETSLFVHCDVTKADDVKNAVDKAVSRFGKLDIMFKNAGIIDPSKVRTTDNEIADFERVLAVNVTGVFLGKKHAARVILPGKQCSIINNGSISSVMGGLVSHAYVASKHTVVGLTKIAAAELGRLGIRVNCISASATASPLARNIFESDDDEIERRFTGMNSLKGVTLIAQDTAVAAIYFGSDESRCVSGHNFVIDGGFTVANTSFSIFNQLEKIKLTQGSCCLSGDPLSKNNIKPWKNSLVYNVAKVLILLPLNMYF
ncbi:secoisolariciresinol dehydrogenase-like [Macadamia integrifolia]|uniref:secoisolariciresinol dehydrogenase-like n=1 Tax=Macadamia integrifolia TaxID=60698 RepID=UPI001C4FCAC9|nr:secoisolariciresinol dehydrogenase-like [Macadamia integrifolia]